MLPGITCGFINFFHTLLLVNILSSQRVLPRFSLTLYGLLNVSTHNLFPKYICVYSPPATFTSSGHHFFPPKIWVRQDRDEFFRQSSDRLGHCKYYLVCSLQFKRGELELWCYLLLTKKPTPFREGVGNVK